MDNSEKLVVPEDNNLNVEGKANVPLCPMCTEELGPPKLGDNYLYKRTNPDTRWFWCADCGCHLGYHRMKKTWKVDPYDLNVNDKIRGYFGLPGVDETK